MVGVAPIAKDSGRRQGRRVVAEGRARVRRVLYMAAVAVSRREHRFAELYRRLVGEGEPRKLALVATTRKMLVTLNAMARTGTAWEEHLLEAA